MKLQEMGKVNDWKMSIYHPIQGHYYKKNGIFGKLDKISLIGGN